MSEVLSTDDYSLIVRLLTKEKRLLHDQVMRAAFNDWPLFHAVHRKRVRASRVIRRIQAMRKEKTDGS